MAAQNRLLKEVLSEAKKLNGKEKVELIRMIMKVKKSRSKNP